MVRLGWIRIQMEPQKTESEIMHWILGSEIVSNVVLCDNCVHALFFL